MDLMLNGWLLDQSLSCRMGGRTAFAPSSGAFGFRDQLQDAMGSLHVDAAGAREQLLRAARHPFEEGDVLQGWLPPEGRGVRTRISDDLVWLPFVTAHYVEGSGAASVLDEHERFDRFVPTEEASTLYDHACRAASVRTGRLDAAHRSPAGGSRSLPGRLGSRRRRFGRVRLTGRAPPQDPMLILTLRIPPAMMAPEC